VKNRWPSGWSGFSYDTVDHGGGASWIKKKEVTRMRDHVIEFETVLCSPTQPGPL